MGDPRLQHIAENFDSMKRDINDTFRFHCTQCGKCCINRHDIILSPSDIFKMAKYLKMSNSEFIHSYCSMHIGDHSRMPIIMLKPVGKDDRCPLLKNNKCSVHKVKPSVCGMYPLGRYIAFPKGDFGTRSLEGSEVKYLLQPLDCGDDSETHTVREWLNGFDIALEDKTFIQWNEAISQISTRIKTLEKEQDMLTMMEVWFITRVVMYEMYDHEQDFLPQLEKNFSNLKTLLMDIPKLKELLSHGGRS